MSESISIPGPAGQLETRITAADTNDWAILCHPHPLYGGTMHDPVLDAIAEVLVPHGIGCARFNFRGVGASEGAYDQGAGKVDDLVAVHDWLVVAHAPDAIWLAGYSFGSNVVWRAQSRIPNVARIVLVAPPVASMDYSGDARANVVVLAGTNDQFVDRDALNAWSDRRFDVRFIDGGDHFFAGRWDALGSALRSLLDSKA